jgi:hypothetical protein
MVVGMLAFGGKWDTLLGLDPTGLYPIKVAEDHAVEAKKVGRGLRSGCCYRVLFRSDAECADVLALLPPGRLLQAPFLSLRTMLCSRCTAVLTTPAQFLIS